MPALLLGPTQGYAHVHGLSLLEAGWPRFSGGVQLAVALLFVSGAYGALLSGLGVTARLGGSEGIRLLILRLRTWRVPVRWYLAAFGLPVLLILPAAALARAQGIVAAAPPLGAWAAPVVFLFHLLTIATQEVGWRGLALPLLQRTRSAEQAAYQTGAGWIVWLLPYLMALYAGRIEPQLYALHLLGWVLTLLGASVIQAWLYNSTASLVLSALYSATMMTVWVMAAGILNWQPAAQLVLGSTTWLAAWLIIRRRGQQGLMHRQAG